MSESKQKKTSPIRLRPRVYEELYDEQDRRRRVDGRKTPYADLLEEAWNAHKHPAARNASIPDKQQNGTLVPSTTLREADSSAKNYGISGVKISKREIPWVIRFLKLIRSKSGVIRKAIKFNCVSFGLIPDGAADELPAGSGASMSEDDLDRLVEEVIGATNELAEKQGGARKSPPKTGEGGAGGRKKAG